MTRGVVFITGASRGFGAALARAFADGLAARGCSQVLWVLLARDPAGLRETAAQLRSAHPAACVVTHAMDLADVDGLPASWQQLLAWCELLHAPPSAPFEFGWLIQNAGSLGPLGRVSALAPDALALAELARAVNCNVTAAIWLAARFTQWARAHVAAAAPARPPALPACAIVNVSSLAALQPFPTSGVYSVVKAARDMLHAVIAAEEAAAGGTPLPVHTLSYAPGPMDTAMQAELRSHPLLDAGMRASFVEMARAGTYVGVDASAAKCFRVLCGGRVASGAHVDYFDEHEVQ